MKNQIDMEYKQKVKHNLLKRLNIILFFLLYTTVTITFIIIRPSPISAHPAFNSYTTLYMDKNLDGEIIPPNRIEGYDNINAYDLSVLLGYSENPEDTFEHVKENTDFLEKHVRNNLQVFNNGQKCETTVLLIPTENNGELLSYGQGFLIDIDCDEEITNLVIHNTQFAYEVPYFVNYIGIYKEANDLIIDTVSSADNDCIFLTHDNLENNENEKIYTAQTDICDSDNDSNNNNPSNNENDKETNANNNKNDASNPNNPSEELNNTDLSYTDNNVPSNSSAYTQPLLYEVSQLLEKKSVAAIIGVLLLVVVVGGLHSLEGGHNKIILATMMMNEEINFRGSIIYVFIFTLTHMSDIIILALGLLVFKKQINIYDKLPIIQTYASYIFVGLSLVIVVKELINLRKNRVKRLQNKAISQNKITSQMTKNVKSNITKKSYNSNEKIETFLKTEHYRTTKPNKKNDKNKTQKGWLRSNTFKEQFMVAFVSGLAPCLTGWTIFILIVSTGELWLLLPATIAFGIGVFLVLITFAFLVNIFKKKVFTSFDNISYFAPLLSGILLLISSIILLI